MKSNMSAVDRAIRLLLIAVIALLYFTGTISIVLAIILGIIVAIFIFSSFTGFCPIYYPFKISSIRKKS